MAFDPVVPIGNNVSIQPADFRRAVVGSTMAHDSHQLAVRTGVISGFAVGTSGTSVVVTQGCGVVTPAQSTNGSYFVSAASSTVGTLATRHTSYDRIDLVGIAVRDGSVDASGKYVAEVSVTTGTASPSPATPAVPTGVLPLAEVRVRAAGGLSVTDIREYTAAAGGVIPVINTNAPTGTSLRPGQPIYVTKQGALLLWTGSTWRQVAYSDELPRVPQIAAGKILAGGAGQYTKVVSLPAGRFQSPPVVTATIEGAAGAVGWNTPKVFGVSSSQFSLFVDTGSQVTVNWIATDAG